MRDVATVRFLWRFMAPLPLGWRMHQVARSLLFPARALIAHLPQPSEAGGPGVLLDLGCGHGVFLALAHRDRPDLELVGLDLSEEKIAGARKVFGASSANVRELAVKDIADFTRQSVDVITILDVLYLVPADQWGDIFRKCYECLKPGGRLLVKEMNPALKWKFGLLMLEETLAVRVLRLTLGKHKKFTFPDAIQVRSWLEAAGFSVDEIPIDRGYSAPHFLWIGRK